MTKPLLSIVTTCHGKCPEFEGFVESWKMQKQYLPAPHSRDANVICPYAKCQEWPEKDLPKIELIFTWDGKPDRIVEFDDIGVEPFDYLPEHFQAINIINPKQGGVGHHTRGPGIEAATGSWILLTNIDNYFLPAFLHHVYKTLEDITFGFVMYNWVSNLNGFTAQRPDPTKRGQIDLQAFCVRSEIAKKIGFPFINYDGDFDYAKACWKECGKLGLLAQHHDACLCIHN